MKTFSLIAAGLGLAVAAVPAAAIAAPPQAQWQSINQRQAQLDRRIDQGVRNGGLSRQEATRLRAEFRQIAQLERRYRANGLSMRERNDLNRRFDALSAKIRWESRDRDHRDNRRDHRR